MRLIPIDPDKPLEHEIDGVVYLFRYITEENADEFYAVAAAMESAKTPEDKKMAGRDLVNYLIVGWKSREGDIVAFPADKPASSRFRINSLMEMVGHVVGLIPELTGTSEEMLQAAVKNSARQQPSPGSDSRGNATGAAPTQNAGAGA